MAKTWKEQPKKGREEEDEVHTCIGKCMGMSLKKCHCKTRENFQIFRKKGKIVNCYYGTS